MQFLEEEKRFHTAWIWNDLVFAITLAIFSAALWGWVALQFELVGWPRHLVLVAAVSAILYGMFDVAEDLMLVRLLGKFDTISKSEAWIACQLTRLKMATIVGSVTGAAVFKILSAATDKAPNQ